ncbi:helix-turn-helix transcriptional regulator [Actinokineospora auranticolor]|uniref:Helix-turn-helix protein n=1 Tax=Actinokineospora auranticolor TaxID=155976 RepID=A0A2S6GLT4_9PSEU|nr:helix-turn-helix transcriptional regulator [Actinokineospora auranticolor]PPK66199.1 helix-turn-helix protein [Actinokineospora auranticolor]
MRTRTAPTATSEQGGGARAPRPSIDDYTATVGAVVGLYRRHQGLPVSYLLADWPAAPTTSRYIAMERGRWAPTLAIVVGVCARMGVDPAWVLAAADGLSPRALYERTRELPAAPKAPDMSWQAAVGACLRRIRQDRDVTVAELTTRLGVDKGALYTRERGRWTPRLGGLRRWCDALDVPLSAVVAAVGPTDAPTGPYLLHLDHLHAETDPRYRALAAVADLLRAHGRTLLAVDEHTVAALATTTGITPPRLFDRLHSHPLTLPLPPRERPAPEPARTVTRRRSAQAPGGSSSHRDEYAVAVGRVLAVYRGHQGLAVADLVARVPSPPERETYRTWERGIRPPSLVAVAQVSPVLGVDPAWVLAAADGLSARDLLTATQALPVSPTTAGTPLMAAVGACLAGLRRDKGITKPEVAARLDVHTESVTQYELGGRAASLDRLRAWCDLLGTHLCAVVAAVTPRRVPALGYLLDTHHLRADPDPDFARLRAAGRFLHAQGHQRTFLDDACLAELAALTDIDTEALREHLLDYPLALSEPGTRPMPVPEPADPHAPTVIPHATPRSDEINRALGTALRHARHTAELTEAALGARFSPRHTAAFVRARETGAKPISLALLITVAQTLSIPATTLLAEAESPGPTAPRAAGAALTPPPGIADPVTATVMLVREVASAPGAPPPQEIRRHLLPDYPRPIVYGTGTRIVSSRVAESSHVAELILTCRVLGISAAAVWEVAHQPAKP